MYCGVLESTGGETVLRQDLENFRSQFEGRIQIIAISFCNKAENWTVARWQKVFQECPILWKLIYWPARWMSIILKTIVNGNIFNFPISSRSLLHKTKTHKDTWHNAHIITQSNSVRIHECLNGLTTVNVIVGISIDNALRVPSHAKLYFIVFNFDTKWKDYQLGCFSKMRVSTINTL